MLQSRLFSSQARAVGFALGPGRSPAIAFPQYGPFDERRGYTEIPAFATRLYRSGFRMREQARVSPALLRLSRWGIYPPYNEEPLIGLRVSGQDGTVLYDATDGRQVYESFDDIANLVVEALLFIENRELAEPAYPTANPRVLDPAVARILRTLLAEVVEQGTARRLAGSTALPDGHRVAVGGKTGSGDNRFKTVSASGQVTSSRAINRTATFVFYVGDRYFGVVTAHVNGPAADGYRFTSALPVTLVRMLMPELLKRLDAPWEEIRGAT